MSEEKGLSGWEHKRNEEKAKEVKVEFGDEKEYVEVEEEEGKKMEEKEEVKEEREVKEETVGEKQYKDMTKEEQSERNQDILLGIGFLYREDKGQFIYKEEELTIGKTFNDKFPTGSQFWGFRGNNKLENGGIKKEEIVKQFYAIREGKEEIPEKEEEQQEEKRELATRAEAKPNAIVQDAQNKADMLYNVVEKQHLYQEIRGKKYLQLEAWQTLGKFCNVIGEIEWVKPVDLWDARGFEARAIIKTVEVTRNEEGGTTTKVGDIIAIAESMCMNDEPNWQGKPIFQLKSMSQTRALSKAYRSCLSFIVALAGYATSPAEEM